MELGNRWKTLVSRRDRRIFVASVVTVLISASLLGLVIFTQWRAHRALQSDIDTVMAQANQQLIRTLQSRRGTLTLLRDTLDRRPNVALPQLQALGESAVEHTRHLVAIGLISAGQRPAWWAEPSNLSTTERAQLNRTLAQHLQFRSIWRVPSLFVTMLRAHRPLLVMLEPFRSDAFHSSAVVGIYNLTTLLEDFFTSALPQPYPAQVLDGDQVLYQSNAWRASEERRTPSAAETHTQATRQEVVISRMAIDGARWTIALQPTNSRLAETLSWFNVLLIGLSLIAGIGITIVVWLLTARAWILQRAVDRRTAALRRVLRRLRQMAITDELTGLYNRRFFLNRWAWECSRAKRYHRPLACLMIDVNGFKQVNDRLGHAIGDLVLKRTAQQLQMLLRQSDILARLGGDEFVIALPETNHVQAASVAEKLRQTFIEIPEGEAQHVTSITLSVGLSSIEEEAGTPEELLEAADQSLYLDKRKMALSELPTSGSSPSPLS